MQTEFSLNRREFIRTTAIAGTGIIVGANRALSKPVPKAQNPIPRWKGFNLLDFFSPDPANAREGVQEEYFKWMADWGFDFVRVPMAYPSYVKFDRSQPITPNRVRKIDKSCRKGRRVGVYGP